MGEEKKTYVKMATPDYVQDIRRRRYTADGAVMKILKECGMKLEPPINVWAIARQLNFEVFEAGFKDAKVSGMMIDSKKVVKMLGCKRAIVLNREENKERQAFTVAHELAHFVLHCNDRTDFFEAYHWGKEKRSLTEEEKQKKKLEDEADKFAAMLLMPTNTFSDVYQQLRNKYDTTELIRAMSKIFMVEDEAVKRRIREIGY